MASPKIHVVYVEGSIVDGWGDDGNAVGGHEIASRLRQTRADHDCKAVVLRINSPGGVFQGRMQFFRRFVVYAERKFQW